MHPDRTATEQPPLDRAEAGAQLEDRVPGLRWVIAATSFGFVVVQLDVTIVNVALPRIGADLGASVAGLQWVVDAYTLAFAVLLLSAGVIGDLVGARRAYLGGFGVFLVASAVCGFAPNAAVLVLARAVQGIGAALLVPSSLALLSRASCGDDRLRARAVGFWTAAGGVSIALGPIAGGILQESLGWRSIFFVNLPVGVIGVALTLRHVLPSAPARDERGFDPLGQLLSILTLTGLTGALIELGPLGASHPLVWGGFALALFGAIAFVRVEARSPAPMLPLRFFRIPGFSPAVVFGVLINLSYYGLIFVLSLYLQDVRGYSAIETGLAYLPLTGTFVASNIASGWVASHIGARVPMVLGAVVGALGFALLGLLGQLIPEDVARVRADPERDRARCPRHDEQHPGRGCASLGRDGVRHSECGTPGGRGRGCGAVWCAREPWPRAHRDGLALGGVDLRGAAPDRGLSRLAGYSPTAARRRTTDLTLRTDQSLRCEAGGAARPLELEHTTTGTAASAGARVGRDVSGGTCGSS